MSWWSASGIAIDILVNNAGHGRQRPFLDVPLDAALSTMQLDIANLTAVTHVLRKTWAHADAGRSCWCQFAVFQGVENFAVYAAAKAYVLTLGEALHRELRRDGITVTVLCPGMSGHRIRRSGRAEAHA